MILNKMNLIAMLLLFSIGASNTSQATECFEKFRKMCVEQNGKHMDQQFNCNDSELKLSNKLFDHYDEMKGEWTLTDLDNYISDDQRRIKIKKSNGSNYSQEEFSICRYQEQKKYYQTGLKPSSNTLSNQASSSSASSNQSCSQSSNQSASATTSNSPESYNIQVSQNNKQNYQAVQRAYEQANAGRGKKHNKEANVIECMKNNPAQKSFKNNCNQPINFAYCFSGTVSGAKNESPQTLADLNCQGGQFGMLTIGAGENIPGSYQGLALEGLACKSPSQPVDMAFDRSANAATGRCSF